MKKLKIYEIVHRFGSTSVYKENKSIVPIEGIGIDLEQLIYFNHLGPNLDVYFECSQNIHIQEIINMVNKISQEKNHKNLFFDSWMDEDGYFMLYYVYSQRDETDEEFKLRVDADLKFKEENLRKKEQKKVENLQKRLVKAQELLAKNNSTNK